VLAVQAACTLGVPGYLARFARWSEVERAVAAGQLLVISVRAQEGELRGAPYRSTDGHLLVLRGFAENGDVEVDDPAARTREAGQTRYSRADLEKVRFRQGGTAYVLLPRQEAR
jgi:glucose-6-phosphate dehydrogenase assembly protein OpcA